MNDSESPIDDATVQDDWSGDEIEAAYRRALEASEAVEQAADASDLANPPVAVISESAGIVKEPCASSGHVENVPHETGPRVRPAQVIEAALFVGGRPLTARRLCGLLRGSFEPAFVEETIDQLNRAYAEQGRPYEIRLADGGYRLDVRPEFERYRHRVYGTGPREVKLSQDVLEVLALVAYKQPVSQAEIEALGKSNAGNILRQLLRRELIGLTRGEQGAKDVRYHTTERFLQLFGLRSLADLPQTEDVARK